jgi:hypothetical protein
MPFPDHPSGISSAPKNSRQNRYIGQEVAGISVTGIGTWLPGCKRTDPGFVGMKPGHERGPGRTAAGRIVKRLGSNTALRKTVKIGGGNFTAVASQIGIAQIVGENHNDIGLLGLYSRSGSRMADGGKPKEK